MSYFDLYGLECPGLEDAKQKVEAALGVQFTCSYSDYVGRHCWYEAADNVYFDLSPNYNDEEEDYTEPEFQRYPCLLTVSDATFERANEVECMLASQPGIQLLRREDL